MAINIEEIIENAFEQAFSRALEQTIQNQAEVLFKKAFENGSPLSKKLEEKIEQGFQRFVDQGIQWGQEEARLQKIRLSIWMPCLLDGVPRVWLDPMIRTPIAQTVAELTKL